MSIRSAPLPALTALRFGAALAVLGLHLVAVASEPGGPRLSPQVGHLAVGVTFFFALSGFILAYNYLDHLRRPTARAVWNFYVARWARVYPVHLLALVVVLPAVAAAVRRGVYGDPVPTTLLNVALLQAFAPDLAPYAFNAAAWSLSAEWFFYLCFPLLIPGLTTGSLARRAAVLTLALAPWLVALAELFGGLPGWRAAGLDPYIFPPVRLADFVAGVVLGVCWHRFGTGAGARRGAGATLVEVATLLALAGWAWQCVRLTPDKGDAEACRWAGAYLPPFALGIWVFARGAGGVSRLLSARPLVYLGEISYAVYMLHLPVIFLALKYGGRIGFPGWAWQWKWAALAATTLVFSAACYHLYEIPMRDWLKRQLSLRPAADAPPGPIAAAPPAARPDAPARRAA